MRLCCFILFFFVLNFGLCVEKNKKKLPPQKTIITPGLINPYAKGLHPKELDALFERLLKGEKVSQSERFIFLIQKLVDLKEQLQSVEQNDAKTVSPEKIKQWLEWNHYYGYALSSHEVDLHYKVDGVAASLVNYNKSIAKFYSISSEYLLKLKEMGDEKEIPDSLRSRIDDLTKSILEYQKLELAAADETLKTTELPHKKKSKN